MSNESLLVTRILAGDTRAWQAFIETYSPLIQKTIGRYVKDKDTAEDLYVSLIEKLKESKLKTFEFRSTLSTWLFIVARNHCRDYFRSTKGIRHVMAVLKDLKPAERRYFELHYIQNLPLHEVLESLRTELGQKVTYLDIIEYEDRLQKKVSKKGLGKLMERLLRPDTSKHHAGIQAVEGRWTLGEGPSAISPPQESMLERRNLEIAIEKLRGAVLRLPHRDQLILKLKFEHKASAREISEILDLGNEKQVYRKLDRLLGELRKMLLESGLSPEIFAELTQDMELLYAPNHAMRTMPLGSDERN
jgi:DNA-directed RNA polymerase specialized sigma24 family protein